MTNQANEFKNYAVLTAQISQIEEKISASGYPYKVGKATLLGLTYIIKGQRFHPAIEVIASQHTLPYLKPGILEICGSLSYRERETADQEIQRSVKIIASSIKKLERYSEHRIRNYVNLSLRIAADAVTRASSHTGELWASARSTLWMGKDNNGDYRPSLWLTLKAFTREGDDSLPYALGDLIQGNHVNIKGGLDIEEYKGRLYWSVILNALAYRQFGQKTQEEEDSIENVLEPIPE